MITPFVIIYAGVFVIAVLVREEMVIFIFVILAFVSVVFGYLPGGVARNQMLRNRMTVIGPPFEM